jgi:hypothetical protein
MKKPHVPHIKESCGVARYTSISMSSSSEITTRAGSRPTGAGTKEVKQDVIVAILCFGAGTSLVLSQWFGYSQYILTFLPAMLLLGICHWVALQIFLRL